MLNPTESCKVISDTLWSARVLILARIFLRQRASTYPFINKPFSNNLCFSPNKTTFTMIVLMTLNLHSMLEPTISFNLYFFHNISIWSFVWCTCVSKNSKKRFCLKLLSLYTLNKQEYHQQVLNRNIIIPDKLPSRNLPISQIKMRIIRAKIYKESFDVFNGEKISFSRMTASRKLSMELGNCTAPCMYIHTEYSRQSTRYIQ